MYSQYTYYNDLCFTLSKWHIKRKHVYTEVNYQTAFRKPPNIYINANCKNLDVATLMPDSLAYICYELEGRTHFP